MLPRCLAASLPRCPAASLIAVFAMGTSPAFAQRDLGHSTEAFIVRFWNPETARNLLQNGHPMLDALDARVTWTSTVAPELAIVQTRQGTADEVRELFTLVREVEYTEPDSFGESTATPNDNLWPNQQPYMDLICARGAWNVRTKATVPFSVLDSGVTLGNCDITQNILVNAGEPLPPDGNDTDGNGYIDDHWGTEFLPTALPAGTFPDPTDQIGHGSLVASIAGARGNNNTPACDNGRICGAAWECSIVPIKISNAADILSFSTVLKGFEYSYVRGVRLANCSFTFYNADSAAVRAYIQATPDVLYVFAAGNGSLNLDIPCSVNIYPPEFPYDNILVVGGCTSSDQLWNTNPDPCSWDEGGTHFGHLSVDLFAPSEEIWTLNWDLYAPAPFSGTSYAAPLVTAFAALKWSQSPNLTALDLKAKILAAVDVLPQYTGYCTTNGRFNASKLLQSSLCN